MNARLRRSAANVSRPLGAWLDRHLTTALRKDGAGRKVEQVSGVIGAWMDQASETDRYLGANLSRLRDAVAGLEARSGLSRAELETLLRELRATRTEIGFLDADVRRALGDLAPRDGTAEVTLAGLDGVTADFMNRATGYLGLAAQAGVFVNDAVNHVYLAGDVEVSTINERIAEVPFVFRELSRLERGARIVDVGSAESTVAVSLASLGYSVTAVDPRGYAFAHPGVVEARVGLAELEAEPFDAAVLLSVIEHVGIEHYDQHDGSGADLELMRSLRELVRPGGLLVLTTPFGRARDAGFQRIYDDAGIRALLDGWNLEHVEVIRRVSDTEWQMTDEGIDPVSDDDYRVVMIVATRASD